jgi:exodeoxyribonuclease V alpha subunit
MATQTQLCGTVTKLIWSAKDSAFRILEVSTDKGRDRKTVLGDWQNARVGARIEAYGEWQKRKGTGELQFRARYLQEAIPEDASGLLAWLKSGAVKGIGKVTAQKLVDHFGEKLPRVLDEDPEQIAACGIRPKQREKIRNGWAAAQATRIIMQFLRKVGIGPERSQAVWKHFSRYSWVGNQPQVLVGRLSDNPYMLTDVAGIGFVQADQAAGNLGLSADSNDRIDAGIRHVITQNTDDGHVWISFDDLLAKALDLLGVQEEHIVERVLALQESAQIVVRPGIDSQRISTRRLAWIERHLALEIQRLNVPARAIPGRYPSGFVPDPDQRKALEIVLRSGFSVLTGGPGMGKTTLIRACVLSAQAAGLRLVLCAPTGRAAKRMEEATGHPASTIHRAIEWRGGIDPGRNSQNPLEADWVIVDEVSMLDQDIALRLLQAVKTGARVLFVGDPDQLPSVGPGNVLGDILESGVVPAARLTKIFRQGEGSGIPVLARSILQGTRVDFAGLNGCAYLDIEALPESEDRFEAVMAAIRAFTEQTGERVQVLSPMRSGPLGTNALNTALREFYNPDRGQDHWKWFRVGDLVIQTKNNYDLGVFNGDMGEIVGFEREDDDVTMLVSFDGHVVRYEEPEDAAALEYAWALTVHKSQGGQFPAVCVLATTSHFVMLKRNLLYTGVTRAEKHLLMISGSRAQRLIRQETGILHRETMLADILKDHGERYGRTEEAPSPYSRRAAG